MAVGPSIMREVPTSPGIAEAGDETARKVPSTKRSTVKGEAREKIIAALTLHHEYQTGGCLNWEAVGVRELARKADVSPDRASHFFKEHFGDHAKYQAACKTDSGNTSLLAVLKNLNDDYSTAYLFGRKPPGEDELGDEE